MAAVARWWVASGLLGALFAVAALAAWRAPMCTQGLGETPPDGLVVVAVATCSGIVPALLLLFALASAAVAIGRRLVA